jgi:hypothetical protein
MDGVSACAKTLAEMTGKEWTILLDPGNDDQCPSEGPSSLVDASTTPWYVKTGELFFILI